MDLKIDHYLKVNLQTARTPDSSLRSLPLSRETEMESLCTRKCQTQLKAGHLTQNWESRSNILTECLDLTSSSTQIPECYRHNLNPLVRRLKSDQTERKALKMVSGWTPLTFGARQFFVVRGCSVHYRVFSSICGLHPPNASSAHTFPVTTIRHSFR